MSKVLNKALCYVLKPINDREVEGNADKNMCRRSCLFGG